MINDVGFGNQVHDASDPSVKKLGINSLPAVVGWLSNGEKEILKSGISAKDLKSTIQELSGLLENFEKRNKKASVRKDTSQSGIPLLAASNFDDICGEKVPVCLIGVFKSATTRDKLQKILQSVSLLLSYYLKCLYLVSIDLGFKKQ